MRTFRREVSTPWDAARVWRYLADFTTVDEWDPRAGNTRRVTGAGGVGARYETDVHFLGRTTRMTYTVTRLVEPRLIEWVGHNELVRAHDVIEVDPCPAGSRIVYTSSYRYTRLPWVLEPLLAWPLSQLCDEAQRGLQGTLSVAESGRA